jgi:hypothetical protein
MIIMSDIGATAYRQLQHVSNDKAAIAKKTVPARDAATCVVTVPAFETQCDTEQYHHHSSTELYAHVRCVLRDKLTA